jgi:hypothetical protein
MTHDEDDVLDEHLLASGLDEEDEEGALGDERVGADEKEPEW